MKTLNNFVFSAFLIIVFADDVFSSTMTYSFTGELSVGFVGSRADPLRDAINDAILGSVSGQLTYDSDGHTFSYDIHTSHLGNQVKIAEVWNVPGHVFIELANGDTCEAFGLRTTVWIDDMVGMGTLYHVQAMGTLPSSFWDMTPPALFMPPGIPVGFSFDHNLTDFAPPPPFPPVLDFLGGFSDCKIVSDFDGDSLGELDEMAFLNFSATSFETVPIPSAIWLLGSGLIGLIGLRRKFRKS